MNKYEKLCRNKWLASKSQNIDDMISSFQFHLSKLKAMKREIDAGKITADFAGADDDYIFFYTDDPIVAEEYGFDETDSDGE